MVILYNDILKQTRFVSLFFLLLPAALFAQVEDVLPLVKMPVQPTFQLKAAAMGDTISLPINDDFSDRSTIPNQTIWADNYVFVNSTIPTNLYSMGAATFDGTDEFGFPYNLKNNLSDTLADVLTSRYIKFASPPTNLFLSFFYQAGGLGELPEVTDSLVVEYWSPVDSAWEKAWSVGGGSVATPFKAVAIPVTQAKHLQNGFRFRFGAYGALNGAFDVWNIDYVELDVNRNAADTIIKEPAFVQPHPQLLKNYTHIPWFHYSDASVKDSLTFTYRRNGPPPPGGWALNLGKFRFKKDGVLVKDRLTVPVITNLIHNTNVTFKVPLQPVVTGTPTDEFTLNMKTWFDGTAEGLRSNDTVEIDVECENFYAIDDGSAERAYGILNQINARIAFQFQPLTPDTLKGLFINFAHAGTDATLNRFRIAIWRDVNGEPGLPIYISDSTYKPVYPFYHNGFMPFELDTAIFIPGSVFIGLVQSKVEGMHVGFDLNNTTSKKYYGGGFLWLESLFPGTLMIRPYFNYTPKDFGFAENNLNVPAVYPNPATQHIFIDQSHAAKTEWILINSLGQKVDAGSAAQIDVANLPRGMYVLQLMWEKNYHAHKIILN